jgi:hypothetical protein
MILKYIAGGIMKKNLFLLSVLPILTLLTSAFLEARTLMIGTIKLPHALASLPTAPRIYHNGKIIKCAPTRENDAFAFQIPRMDQQFRFNIVITESIEFEINDAKIKDSQQNTISYLKIPDGQKYKMYTLLLVPQFSNSGPLKATTLQYQWKIRPDSLMGHTRQIPDDALIICYDPAWVDSLVGENSFDLPTIKLRDDIVSNKSFKFHEKSSTILLNAMNSDTWHEASSLDPMKHDPSQKRVTIAAPMA